MIKLKKIKKKKRKRVFWVTFSAKKEKNKIQLCKLLKWKDTKMIYWKKKLLIHKISLIQSHQCLQMQINRKLLKVLNQIATIAQKRLMVFLVYFKKKKKKMVKKEKKLNLIQALKKQLKCQTNQIELIRMKMFKLINNTLLDKLLFGIMKKLMNKNWINNTMKYKFKI